MEKLFTRYYKNYKNVQFIYNYCKRRIYLKKHVEILQSLLGRDSIDKKEDFLILLFANKHKKVNKRLRYLDFITTQTP